MYDLLDDQPRPVVKSKNVGYPLIAADPLYATETYRSKSQGPQLVNAQAIDTVVYGASSPQKG